MALNEVYKLIALKTQWELLRDEQRFMAIETDNVRDAQYWATLISINLGLETKANGTIILIYK